MNDGNADSRTVVSWWLEQVRRRSHQTGMLVKRDGSYEPISWNAIHEQVRRTAAALTAQGVLPGDRVILVSRNRFDWIVCDLAILMARAIHVPVHAALSGQQIEYQIRDSEAKLVILENAEQVEKASAISRAEHAEVKWITLERCDRVIDGNPLRCLADSVREVDDQAALACERDALTVDPDAVATILYTSGTTGEPKGVMLTHRNLAFDATAMIGTINLCEDDVRLTWLPLSHIYARTCDLYTWVITGRVLALADSVETIVADAQLVHPTCINCVPYFYDKIYRYLAAQGVAEQAGAMRELLGGRLRVCGSGGAALASHTEQFLQRQGLTVLQGYGLTEASPTISSNREGRVKPGTVGELLEGVEVRIAEDGEILTRGPHVMLGYWKLPQATAEAIHDGWLHTGDLGHLDEEGYLTITGRKKELIVTAAGKNIAPVAIEALLTADPLIDQAVVIGDGRNYLTALVVVCPQALQATANRLGISATNELSSLIELESVKDIYAQRIADRLSCVSHYEQVRRFTLLASPFTAEKRELTLTLKLRRQAIQANYASTIEAMYDQPPVEANKTASFA